MEDFEVGEAYRVELLDGQVVIVQAFSGTATTSTGETVHLDGVQLSSEDGRILGRYVAVSVAAGAGLLDYGAQEEGITTVLAFEVNEDAAAQYQANHGNKVVLGDVREVGVERIDRMVKVESPSGRVDVLLAGIPCEPYTWTREHEGSDKTGGNDERNLFPFFVELVAQLRPLAFLVENVPGLVEIPRHRQYLYAEVMPELQDLGYHLTITVVDAKDFGNASDRRRVFLLGSQFGPVTLPAATHGPGAVKPYVPMREACAEVLRDKASLRRTTLPSRATWYCERPEYGGDVFLSGADVAVSLKSWNKRTPQYRLLDEPYFTVMSTALDRCRMRLDGQWYIMDERVYAPLQGVPPHFVDLTTERIGDGVAVPLSRAAAVALVRHLDEHTGRTRIA